MFWKRIQVGLRFADTYSSMPRSYLVECCLATRTERGFRLTYPNRPVHGSGSRSLFTGGGRLAPLSIVSASSSLFASAAVTLCACVFFGTRTFVVFSTVLVFGAIVAGASMVSSSTLRAERLAIFRGGTAAPVTAVSVAAVFLFGGIIADDRCIGRKYLRITVFEILQEQF